eukprot:GHVT01103588.1.p1 GENE.GHVT01103588.1~~GHVT01103588.1.p1  ORF type:complete len:253 (-),score=39.99 GHVT01103588.1:1500-2258(-)
MESSRPTADSTQEALIARRRELPHEDRMAQIIQLSQEIAGSRPSLSSPPLAGAAQTMLYSSPSTPPVEPPCNHDALSVELVDVDATSPPKPPPATPATLPASHTPSQQSLPPPPLHPDPEFGEVTRYLKPEKVKGDSKPAVFFAEMRGSKWLDGAMRKFWSARGTPSPQEVSAILWETVTAGLRVVHKQSQTDSTHRAAVDAAVGEGMAAQIMGQVTPAEQLKRMVCRYMQSPRMDYWRVRLAAAQGAKLER